MEKITDEELRQYDNLDIELPEIGGHTAEPTPEEMEAAKEWAQGLPDKEPTDYAANRSIWRR